MLLRKHIGSARILDVKQPGMERVVEFELEHLNELGESLQKASDHGTDGQAQQHHLL